MANGSAAAPLLKVFDGAAPNIQAAYNEWAKEEKPTVLSSQIEQVASGFGHYFVLFVWYTGGRKTQ